jgi:DNA repair exonuclease SbcCD ATPase subunit
MPIKMATGRVNSGHEESVPLGVISHLKEEENKIVGLAALWNSERQEDVELLKKMKEEGKNPQLSWEVYYTDSTKDELGIEDLHGITVKATTIVGLPAYGGRTPILAMSAKETTEEVVSNVEVAEEIEANQPSINTEENVEELEKLMAENTDLKTKLAELEAKTAELETELAGLKSTISEKEASLETQNSELVSLREFKVATEKKEADLQKLASIKQKFNDAGITKDDSYFNEKKDLLLGMGELELDFMVQEMIAFSNSQKPAVASVTLPPVHPVTSNLKDPKELAKALKEFSTKQVK